MAAADKTITVLGWFVLITLMCAIARQLSEQVQLDLTPSFFGRPGSRHTLLERFTNASDSVSGKPDEDQYRPAEAKASYNLLTDVLAQKQEAGVLTAKSCYEKDFLALSAKTGNFIQRTNNYRHGAPDNCTAPRTELVDSFYRNP